MLLRLDLLELLNDRQALKTGVGQVAPSGHRSAAAELSDLADMAPDEYSRAVSGLLNALGVFGLPRVAAVTRGFR